MAHLMQSESHGLSLPPFWHLQNHYRQSMWLQMNHLWQMANHQRSQLQRNQSQLLSWLPFPGL